jgi:hypothetical protein
VFTEISTIGAKSVDGIMDCNYGDEFQPEITGKTATDRSTDSFTFPGGCLPLTPDNEQQLPDSNVQGRDRRDVPGFNTLYQTSVKVPSNSKSGNTDKQLDSNHTSSVCPTARKCSLLDCNPLTPEQSTVNPTGHNQDILASLVDKVEAETGREKDTAAGLGQSVANTPSSDTTSLSALEESTESRPELQRYTSGELKLWLQEKPVFALEDDEVMPEWMVEALEELGLFEAANEEGVE